MVSMISVSTDTAGNMVSLERACSPLEGFLSVLVLRWETEEGARRMERRPVGCARARFPWEIPDCAERDGCRVQNRDILHDQ